MKSFIEALTQNVLYALEFLGIAVGIFLISYIAERAIRKKNGETGKYFTARKMALIAMLSAIAGVLMIFDFPIFFAPVFYKMDFSELPALIGCFAFGPLSGVLIEFLKILVKLMIKGTTTAFVGELANFLIGSSFILAASLVYIIKKNKKAAIWGCILGTVIMTIFAAFMNAYYLLPVFAEIYGMPLETIIAMGTKINEDITDMFSFVALAVAPLTFIKGAFCSLITIFVYKKLRKFIHN